MAFETLVAGFFARVFSAVLSFLSVTWWFWLFFILLPLARSAWLAYKQRVMEHGIKFVTLEMKIPREVLKNPRSMDQFLQSLHSLGNYANDFGEKYLDGEVTRWYSLEMVSFSGEIHFYLRIYYKQRALIEAAFFSYYPDVELVEVEDYAHKMARTYADVVAQGNDLWGGEMILKKSAMYPIKTYLKFETPDESAQLDPMGAFMEALGKAKPGEFVGIQYNISPIHKNRWPTKDLIKGAEELKKPKRMEIDTSSSFPMTIPKSRGESNIIEAIEENFAKPAFYVIPRFLYVSPKKIFYDSFARRGIAGSFNQYGSIDLNFFLPNYDISTRVRAWNPPYFFPKLRERLRKQRILQYYHEREFITHTFIGKLLSSHPLDWNFKSKPIILNCEALATLFHPPTNLVLTAPHTQRVESRKYAAPAGLPIYGDEADIEQFYAPKEKKVEEPKQSTSGHQFINS